MNIQMERVLGLIEQDLGDGGKTFVLEANKLLDQMDLLPTQFTPAERTIGLLVRSLLAQVKLAQTPTEPPAVRENVIFVDFKARKKAA